ncbi:hypothetical protein [Wenzhouxiangella marina]|uniref:hypothetical protein n=1 Tax=Wenzhouxiangella marina TaxID=1579979 RepID=UPI0012E0EC06|nr:hypothetical protein [Wenzhouxiangella marina]MBB6088273.1 hypothetical protein [Wenzhouxiangella marina]
MTESTTEENEVERAPRQDIDAQKLERLRDRTDEIELIISGLTTFALFTLPGWLFESLSQNFAHYSAMMQIATNLSLIVVPGLFYSLGFCFAIHLMVRAYWAGLIGLQTVFPNGINWSRASGLGPLTRRYHREHLPSLPAATARADHFASALFAVISMIALGVLWIAVLMISTLMVAGVIGERMGHTNQGLGIGSLILVSLLAGLPILLWVLDAGIGRLFPRLAGTRAFQALIRALNRFLGWIWPQRLILPVQLVLQTNTRPFIFALCLIVGVTGIITFGQFRYAAWTQFSLSNEFTYLDDATVAEGMRSTYYEDQRSLRDRMRLYPMIDSFVQSQTVMRVFLPYQPLRDNLMLERQCGPEDDRLDCLRRIWRVSLDGRVLDPQSLIPTERFDLNLRGLTGVVGLDGLSPGLHTLEVIWNPEGDEVDGPVDDRYQDQIVRRYAIPFLFSPAYEVGLPNAVQ